MRLSTTLLIPALASLVYATTTEPAKVYVLSNLYDQPAAASSKSPTLSPEEARLVIAHRLGVSSYHSLENIHESTLEYINTFGSRKHKLFSDVDDEEELLVVMMDGASEEMANTYVKELGLSQPAFTISNPPSFEANKQLAKDIRTQCTATGLFRSRIIVNWDLSKEDYNPVDNLDYYRTNHRSVLLVIFPESSYQAKHSSKPYGNYELPSASQIYAREEQTEEPITVDTSSLPIVPGVTFSPVAILPLPKVAPFCYSSEKSCNSSTNYCSGHGVCFEKYAGADGGDPCFACQCMATRNERNTSNIYWGGGACSKVDISSPFWLISGFTVVMVFLISWAIGMLFSIGEEKLPGVIGAGVSSAKTR